MPGRQTLEGQIVLDAGLDAKGRGRAEGERDLHRRPLAAAERRAWDVVPRLEVLVHCGAAALAKVQAHLIRQAPWATKAIMSRGRCSPSRRRGG